jgi:hypothetical protein
MYGTEIISASSITFLQDLPFDNFDDVHASLVSSVTSFSCLLCLVIFVQYLPLGNSQMKFLQKFSKTLVTRLDNLAQILIAPVNPSLRNGAVAKFFEWA